VPASRPAPVRISAHAGHSAGPRGRTAADYRAAAGGADYAELDIRRTGDGTLVAFHDERTRSGHPLARLSYPELCARAGYPVPTAAEVLTAISGRARGHLDLKEPGAEDDLARLALDILGPGQFVITTPWDASVRAIRARFPRDDEVPVALTLGRGLRGASPAEWRRTRYSELRPLARLRACGASWVALHHRLALAGVARQCRAHGLRVMVWTVNAEPEIRYWLARGQADVLVTDRPALAVVLRGAAIVP
jgi:glycerophosphoryl diester phosphodiesterase